MKVPRRSPVMLSAPHCRTITDGAKRFTHSVMIYVGGREGVYGVEDGLVGGIIHAIFQRYVHRVAFAGIHSRIC